MQECNRINHFDNIISRYYFGFTTKYVPGQIGYTIVSNQAVPPSVLFANCLF